MICDVVQDLLPSYADGLTSEESNREIEKHLRHVKNAVNITGR